MNSKGQSLNQNQEVKHKQLTAWISKWESNNKHLPLIPLCFKWLKKESGKEEQREEMTGTRILSAAACRTYTSHFCISSTGIKVSRPIRSHMEGCIMVRCWPGMVNILLYILAASSMMVSLFLVASSPLIIRHQSSQLVMQLIPRYEKSSEFTGNWGRLWRRKVCQTLYWNFDHFIVRQIPFSRRLMSFSTPAIDFLRKTVNRPDDY